MVVHHRYTYDCALLCPVLGKSAASKVLVGLLVTFGCQFQHRRYLFGALTLMVGISGKASLTTSTSEVTFSLAFVCLLVC